MKSSHRHDLSLRGLLLAQLCFTLGAPFASAQTAPADSAVQAKTAPNQNAKLSPAQAKAITANAKQSDAAAKPAPDGETLELSPFEVTTSNTGYYSANTMSGTRFNTKLDDLASSITVMTKQQMSDFGMLDINDVFLYVAGTEGTGTYTDYSLDRNGSLSDNVQLNPTGANRIRGIAPANVALDNIETMNRTPLDPIILDSLEISRGANANVFGLGNPSGTVNIVPTSANLNTNHDQVQFRADSYGGYRTSLDVNQVLLKGKLAIRGSAVYQEDDFVRKPSGVKTERYNAMIKYKPFKNTTISGSMFYYHAYGNRPNALPPRDNLSYWIASGKPTWDPVTQQIHINGATVATVTAATYNGPDYFSASYLGNSDSQLFIDQSGVGYWASARGTTSTAGPSVATLQAARYLQPTAVAGAVFSGTAPRPFAQFLFNTTPTISDKSIYDWSSINLSAPNSFWDRSITSNIKIDQTFINTLNQSFVGQVAFMREDSQRWARNLLGIANDNGQSGQLTVDVNERLLDGSPNPYFLRPYISEDKPRTTSNPAKWDTSRAQLAYRLDLRQQDNLLKYLGWFQATAYGEYKYRINRQYSYRDVLAGASWIPANTYLGFQSAPSGFPAVIGNTSNLYRFYVGDKVGNNVDYAPSNFSYGTYPYVWGNAATGVFKTENLTLESAGADKTGGTFNTKIRIKTVGAVLQNHLLDDRFVATVGARYDQVFTQFGNLGNPVNAYLNPDGATFNTAYTDGWQPTIFKNGGRTNNVQLVLRPFADTKFANGLANSTNTAASYLGTLLNGLTLNSNRSDSFLPTNPAQDLFQHLLPNPSGSDKTFGMRLNLTSKVNISITHFDTYAKDSQNGDASTMSQRVTRTDVAISGATPASPPINLQPNVQRWITAQNPSMTTDQVNAAVATAMGLSQEQLNFIFLPNPPIGTTNDIESKGTEVEININPNRFWTVSGSVSDTKAVDLNVSKTLADWIAQRMPIWTTIVDPTWNTDATLWSPATVAADNAAGGNPNHLWWLHHYSATGQSPAENYQAFVGAPYGIIKAQEGKSNPQVSRYTFRVSTAYQLAGISDNKVLKHLTIGGAYRWQSKIGIGYYGVQSLPAIITDLDPNRPIYDKARGYVDAFVSYKTKLWRDKIGATFAINVKNLGEKTRLQPVGAFPDGSISTYRIMDPQQILFTTTFDF